MFNPFNTAARIEALEIRNAELEAQVEQLEADNGDLLCGIVHNEQLLKQMEAYAIDTERMALRNAESAASRNRIAETVEDSYGRAIDAFMDERTEMKNYVAELTRSSLQVVEALLEELADRESVIEARDRTILGYRQSTISRGIAEQARQAVVEQLKDCNERIRFQRGAINQKERRIAELEGQLERTEGQLDIQRTESFQQFHRAEEAERVVEELERYDIRLLLAQGAVRGVDGNPFAFAG